MNHTVTNPVCPSGADPWVIGHDGRYYYCYSGGNGVFVAEIPSPTEISSCGKRVYTAPAGTTYSQEYWAPELHRLQGAWYIYVAADDGDNEHHRMYVLKGTSDDPTEPFEMVGKIGDESDKWAIDGTVLSHRGELYLIWSGWEGDVNVAQNLYIARMSDPCTVCSPRVLLSSPEHGWERIGQPWVNEGPAVLQMGGQTFVTYSASGSWTDDYCLGLLTLRGEDPMEDGAWEKSKEPVFVKRQGVCYGPGHNCFCTDGQGRQIMIYHGNLVSGSGWAGRSVWVSPVNLSEDGTLMLGRPERQVTIGDGRT